MKTFQDFTIEHSGGSSLDFDAMLKEINWLERENERLTNQINYLKTCGDGDVRRMAVIYWQDDLAKFFPTSKGPTSTEILMYEAGYKAGQINAKE